MRTHVFWIRGPRRQAKLKLQGSFFVIGRAEGFPVFQDDPTISRDHVAVVATSEGVRIRDLGARNGVLLNGRRLERYAEVDLAPGDQLQVGSTLVRLLLEGEEPEAALLTVDGEGRRTGVFRSPGAEGAPEEAAEPEPTPEELAALERTQGFELDDAEETDVDPRGTEVAALDDAEETQVLDDDPAAEAGEATQVLEDEPEADEVGETDAGERPPGGAAGRATEVAETFEPPHVLE